MNRQQAHIALSLVIPIVTLMVLSPTLTVKAITSGSNSATVGNGVATATSGNCIATVSRGKASVVCTPCPPGQDGTLSTEDDPNLVAEAFEHGVTGEVSASGSCFPHNEDEPSSMESQEHMTTAES